MALKRPHIAHSFPRRQADGFQEQYIAAREKEKRLYSDAQVRNLPLIERSHPHYKEWLAREQSSRKLLRYIINMHRPLKILEAGCGNGWLASKLSAVQGAAVTGFDINQVELQQARRVFGHQANLRFISRHPFEAAAEHEPYDLIVFAASIQYFASLETIITTALKHLQQDGEIHIIDSHFYKPEDIPAAKKRTEDHYASLGFPGLSRYYFHHSLNALEPFNHKIIYDPQNIWNRLMRRKNPFHWICIKK